MQPAVDARKNRHKLQYGYTTDACSIIYIYTTTDPYFLQRSRNRPPDTTHFTRSYWESLFGTRKIETDFCMPYAVQIIKNDELIPGTAFT